jgi:hypothetical protein
MEALEEAVAGIDKNRNPIFERYTEQAKRAIFFARYEALRRGELVISVADLLAGLSLEDNTRATRVGTLKENAFYLRWLSGLPPLPMSIESLDWKNPEIHTELHPETKKALAFAVLEADRDREYWIDSDHLLRGILRFPNQADFALLKTELTLKSARAASRLDREEFLPQENPSIRVVQYLIRKHLALWGPPAVSLACYLYILIEGMGVRLLPLAR